MKRTTLTLATTLLLASQTFAEPISEIRTLDIERGELEFELQLGTEKEPDEARETVAELSLGYGVTKRWATELGLEVTRSEGDTEAEALEWENRFLLTTPHKGAFAFGVLAAIEVGLQSDSGWGVALGPIFQYTLNDLQLNFTPVLEREFDTEDEAETELSYEWQLSYQGARDIEFGLHGMGELGKWNDWEQRSEQIHKAGPFIAGDIYLDDDDDDAIRYTVAWLSGLNGATSDDTFRLAIEFEL